MTKDRAISWLHSNQRLEYSGSRNACVALTDEVDRLEKRALALRQALHEIRTQASNWSATLIPTSHITQLVDKVLARDEAVEKLHQQKEKDANAACLLG